MAKEEFEQAQAAATAAAAAQNKETDNATDSISHTQLAKALPLEKHQALTQGPRLWGCMFHDPMLSSIGLPHGTLTSSRIEKNGTDRQTWQ